MGAHRKPSPSAPERVRTAARVTALTAAAGLGVVVGIDNAPAHAAELPQINWNPIINCESGGDATVDRLERDGASTASGLFQFLDSSWLAYGGGQFAPRAKQATVAQQFQIANAAYAASGLSPWTASQGCWGSHLSEILHGGTAPAAAPVRDASVPARHASNRPAPQAAPSTTPPRHAAPAHPAPAHPAPAADRSPIPSGDYTVKPGDTLSMIAYRHGDNGWNGLYQHNRSTVGDNPDLILPGQHLRV